MCITLRYYLFEKEGTMNVYGIATTYKALPVHSGQNQSVTQVPFSTSKATHVYYLLLHLQYLPQSLTRRVLHKYLVNK